VKAQNRRGGRMRKRGRGGKKGRRGSGGKRGKHVGDRERSVM